jgi:ketosteroid isomerase-like protein
MSQESAEHFIRRLYQRFNVEGIDGAAEDFFDAAVEYHDDPLWPGGGAHNGRPATIARFKEVIQVLGIKEAVVERVVDTGEELAWIVRVRGRSGSDVPNDHRWGYVGRIADGKLVYFRAYYDAEEAFGAVGC